MKQKLIKISEDYYIVVDDSEIKEGDYYIDDANTIRRCVTSDKDYWSSRVDYKKITHSTKSMYEGRVIKKGVVDNVKAISLLEVKEALYGYSIEDMALEYVDSVRSRIDGFCYLDIQEGYQEGFKAAQKLMKDKQFTKGDIMNLVFEYEESNTNLSLQEFFLKALAPKMEWDVTFNKNNKLKII